MTKPHEETWEMLTGEDSQRFVHSRGVTIAEVLDGDAERLIVQAPAMARLLLADEADDLAGDTACRVCRGIVEDALHDRETGAELSPKAIAHKPDCERMRVLRAAGVLP